MATSSRRRDRQIRERAAGLRRLPDEQRADALAEHVRSGEPVSEAVLLRLATDRSSQIRMEVLMALRGSGCRIAPLAARAALLDPDSLVRSEAVVLLGQYGCARDTRALAHVLEHDEDWAIRSDAADSLGALGYRRARPALEQAVVRDVHPVVRRDAAFALASIGDSACVPLLEEALTTEEHEQGRLGIVAALYRLGRGEYLTLLLHLLSSGDGCVRHATVNSLDMGIHEDDLPRVLAALRAMIAQEENPGVRSDARRMLQSLEAAQLG